MPENETPVRDEQHRAETLDRFSVAINRGSNQPQLHDTRLRHAEEHFNRDRDRPHEATLNRDQYEKVETVNSEYLDVKMFEYLDRMLDAESAEHEKQYGHGRLAELRQFLEETDLGKILKVGGKLTLAALMAAVTAGTGGLTAPLLLAVAPLAVDAALEGAQYIVSERDRIQRLRRTRGARIGRVLNTMFHRNAIHNDDDTATHVSEDIDSEVVIGPRSTEGLEGALLDDIQGLEIYDQEILEQQEDLARVRTTWGIARLLAQAPFLINAISAAANGIALGVQNFDNIKKSHDVILNVKNGIGFIRDASEMATGASALGSAANLAPVGTIVAGAVGSATAMLGMLGARVNEIFKQQHIENTPEEVAPYTLRGRTETGNAQHEISGNGDGIPDQVSKVDREGKIKDVKEAMKPGTIWKWTIAPKNGTSKTEFIEIRGFNNGNLDYNVIDSNGNTEYRTYESKYSDDPFYKATPEASNLDEYKKKSAEEKKVHPTIKEICEKEGIAIPESGQEWLAIKDFVLPSAVAPDGPLNIAFNERIKINRLKDARTKAAITIIGRNGVEKAGGLVNTAEFITNTTLADRTESESKKDHDAVYKDIEKVLTAGWKNPVSLKENIVVGVGNVWYKIKAIDRDKGVFDVARHNASGTEDIKDDPFKTLNFSPMSFENFLKIVEQKDEVLPLEIRIISGAKPVVNNKPK